MVFLISNKDNEYSKFMAQALETFAEERIAGIAIVALTEDNRALTGYWNMDLQDKLKAETELRFDSIDEFIQANRDRYFAAE